MYLTILSDSLNLRWLTTVFQRLSNPCYDCLPDVSIGRVCKTDASLPFQHLKGVKYFFGIRNDSFKLRSNMCLSLGPIKYDKKARSTTSKGAVNYSWFSHMQDVVSHEHELK